MRLRLLYRYHRDHHNALYTPLGISRHSHVFQATSAAARAPKKGQRIVTVAAAAVPPVAAAVAPAAGLASSRRLARSPPSSSQESLAASSICFINPAVTPTSPSCSHPRTSYST